MQKCMPTCIIYVEHKKAPTHHHHAPESLQSILRSHSRACSRVSEKYTLSMLRSLAVMAAMLRSLLKEPNVNDKLKLISAFEKCIKN